MRPTSVRVVRGLLASAIAVVAMGASAAAPMFPRPLHLVRRIDDPIAGNVMQVDEYYSGNRIVSVRGSLCAITDFDAQQLTEIDHARRRFSVTRFDELAKAQTNRLGTSANAAVAHDEWKATPLGMKSTTGGRAADAYLLERPHESIAVSLDREIKLSRAAIEAVIGATYPNPRREEHDAILHAAGGLRGSLHATANGAGGATDAPSEYALPIEQTITADDGHGNKISVHQTVLRVAYEAPPAVLMQIDAGAERVESDAARMNRETDELLHPSVRSGSEKP